MPKGAKASAAPRGEARSYLASIVEFSDDAIIGKKTDGTIISWNPAAKRIYGYSAGEAIGENISILAPPDRRDEMPQILRRIRRGERIAHYETVRMRKDGRNIDVSITVSPVKDRRGRIVGASTIARDITGKKRAEEALRESEERLRNLMESAPIGIAISSPGKKILEANPAVCSMFGYTREEFLRRKTPFYFYDKADEKRLLGGLLRKGFVKDLEARMFRKDGTVFWVSATSVAQRTKEGRARFITTVSDITERKKVEEQLRTTSLYARSLIEASLDPLVTISPGGKITDVNKATEEVTGVAREKLIGADFSGYFTEPDKARKGYKQVLARGFVRDYPLAIRHVSGRVTDVLYNATVYKDEQGNVIGVFAAARDTTERKRAEEQLHAASLYARSLIEASIDPLVTIGPDGRITDVNKATEQVTGVPRDRLIGTDFSRYFTKPDEARKGYKQVFARGFVKDYPLSIRHKSGKVTDVLYNATVYKNELGEVEGVFAAARDITERKQAEERLRESEEKYRTIFENTGTATIIIEEDTTISTANAEFEKLSGYSKGEVEGKRSWAEFAVRADVDRMMEYHRLRRIDPSLAPRNYEFRFITKGGGVRNAFLTIDIIPGTKKSVASISDITKLKQAESQLTEEKKKVEALLALKDEFIIDIGHELKTPLSIILGNLALLRGIAPSEREKEWLAIIEMLERNSVRLGGSIDKILELYKIGIAEIKKEKVQIHEVLEDVYREQAPLAKLKGLKFEIDVEPVDITGDGSLLRLALSNLVNNAIKFTNRGGVSIALRPANGNVSISVSDTGIGISPENQKRLFEKFFKADPSAPGTGIGLAITKEITDKHGGEIRVASAPGKGSTFELILPRST